MLYQVANRTDVKLVIAFPYPSKIVAPNVRPLLFDNVMTLIKTAFDLLSNVLFFRLHIEVDNFLLEILVRRPE